MLCWRTQLLLVPLCAPIEPTLRIRTSPELKAHTCRRLTPANALSHPFFSALLPLGALRAAAQRAQPPAHPIPDPNCPPLRIAREAPAAAGAALPWRPSATFGRAALESSAKGSLSLHHGAFFGANAADSPSRGTCAACVGTGR